MNQPRDLDAVIATWLDDGPVDLPDETRRAISVGLRTQPRVRRMAILGGSSMLPINRFAAAGAVLLAVGALSAFVLSNRAGGPGATPSLPVSAAPSPSTPPSIAPSQLTITTGWVAFSSTRYGYQIAHPPTWTSIPAGRNWTLATDQSAWQTTAADHFMDQATPAASTVLVTSFAVDVRAGTAQDRWILDYYKTDTGSCGVTAASLVPTTVDGQPGWIVNSTCSDLQALVFIGNRVHVFAVWVDGQGPLLDAFLSTVKFTPPSRGGSLAPSARPS